MSEKICLKEFNGLEQPLITWGMKAVSDIKSPEMQHKAAENLRERIDSLLNNCEIQDREKKTEYVLEVLGDAEVCARKLKEEYALKRDKNKDKKVGIVCLFLSGLCAIYPYMAFFVFPNENPTVNTIGMHYVTAKGAGAGWVLTGAFLVFGIWLLIQSRKDD